MTSSFELGLLDTVLLRDTLHTCHRTGSLDLEIRPCLAHQVMKYTYRELGIT